MDDWGWGVPGAGFEEKAIPTLFRLDDQGKPTIDWVDRSIWGEDNTLNIVKGLKPWLQTR